MTSIGIVLVVLAFLGLLVYYVKVGINAQRNQEAMGAQSKAQEAALAEANRLAAEREREERLVEANDVATVGDDRERANQLLRDALKDDLN